MKKRSAFIISLVLVLILSAGCSQKDSPEASLEPSNEPVTEKQTISLASLRGPTTMGLVRLLDDAKNGEMDYLVENEIYGAPDEITSLIIAGKLDMAAIPCNLASILYNKIEGEIQVAAVNTLGVLNVIELGDSINSISDLVGKTVYSTGKGTTPEYGLNAILRANGIDPETDLNIEYLSESTEIAAMLTGEGANEGTIAVLPQPYATTVLMQNPDTRIALDLKDEWTAAGLDGNLLTGVLIVSRKFAEENSELLDKFLNDYEKSTDWVKTNEEDAAQLIADMEIVANPEIAIKALPHCSIVFESGSEMKLDVSSYLEILFEQNPASVGGELPGDAFYYNA